ncbi:MAG: sigma-70 family RNA polymerase sigma factor [Gemmatimonadaceae bacterium]|nr:sigma-70 family RNA polymerase sigma factor [Gemmatimonadaceae bacterium]
MPLPPTDLTAEQLRLLRAGDASVLAELYHHHAARLVRVARRITQDAGDAEDVVHDVFVGLTDAARHYEPRGRFVSWLVTCTVRTALMRRRAAGRRREVTFEQAWPAGTAPTAASRPDLAAELADVEARLIALPATQRSVISLRLEGFSHAEIAQALGISEGNSRVRLARALEQLIAADVAPPRSSTAQPEPGS